MRSKRSKAWHLRKENAREIRKARHIIEHGIDALTREVTEAEEFLLRARANFVPVAQYAIKPINEYEIGSIENVRLVRVPK